MGIYGESMSLVNEGRLSDKFKKILNKFSIKNAKKDIKVEKGKESTYDKADKEIFKMKYTGHFAFYKDYFRNNYEKIFCKLTAENVEKYLKDIEDIFGTTDYDGIIDIISKDYEKLEFIYSEKDRDENRKMYDKLYKYHLKIVKENVNIFTKYENENYIKKGIETAPQDDIFYLALRIQVDLFNIMKATHEAFIKDLNNNWKKYVEEHETDKERAERYMYDIKL